MSENRSGEWLDGPGLVEWMGARGLHTPSTQLGERLARRVRAWHAGSCANVYDVDEALLQLGLHLAFLPDSMWLAGAVLPDRTSRFTEDQRRDAALRHLAGASSVELGRELEVDPKRVRAWAERLRDQLASRAAFA